MTQSLDFPVGSRSELLFARSQEFEQLLNRCAFDSDGIMLNVLHFDDLRPLRREELDDGIFHPRDVDPVSFIHYEDSGIAMGSLLIAQTCRYATTGDEGALVAARKTLDGIRRIYDLGRPTKEGFFPKPYGGKISEQVSRDQYLYVMVGLDLYLKLTPVGGHEGIARMITSMASYWIDCNYTTLYYDLPASSHIDDFMGSLFLGIMKIAAAHSESPLFEQEYRRLIDECGLLDTTLLTLRELYRKGHTYDGGTLFRQQENPVLMKTLAVDLLWDLDPERRDLWREALERYRADDLWVTHNPASRLNFFCTAYDVAEDRVLQTEPGVIPGIDNPLNLACLSFGGQRQSPGSLKTAIAALQIGHRLDDEESIETAWDILHRMGLEQMRLMTVPDPSHIPPDTSWHTRALYTGGVAQWLAAYWFARLRSHEGEISDSK